MNELNKQIAGIQEAGIATLRSRLNQALNAMGLQTADGGASLVSWLVIAFLGINLFFALNIGCGLLLGEVFGSLGLGFLALAGIYIVLIIIYLIIKSMVEQVLRIRLARKIHHLTDNINNNLNQIPELRVSNLYREAYISSEPFPYQALRLRRDEAAKQASKAGKDVVEGVQYIRYNYLKLFGSLITENIPGYRYIAPLTSKGENKTVKTKSKEPSRVVEFIGKNVQGIAPYLPYIGTAFGFLRPIVSSILISKTQSWILSKIFGIGKRKKK